MQWPLIRQADPDDIDAVFELARLLAITFTVDRDAFKASFAATIDSPSAHLLVADDDHEVCGYLLGFEHPSFFANGPVAWVEEVVVAADRRRCGLGSGLMAEFESRIRGRNGRLVALATTRASNFYTTIGYSNHAVYFRKLL